MIVKRFVKLAVLAMMSLVVACGDGGDSGSSSGGSTPQPAGYTVDESGTWLISSEAGLRAFADLVNDSTSQAMRKTNAKLVDNITLSDGWNPIGYSNGSSLTKAYEGTFDGDNHSITGLVIQNTKDYQALFGYVIGGTVKNLKVIDPQISGKFYISAVVAYNSGGNIENVHVDGGRITGEGPTSGAYSYIASISAVNNNGKITSCSNNNSVLSGSYVYSAGIVAYNSGTITSSSNSGSNFSYRNGGTIISCTNTGGDFVSFSNHGTITSCTNTGGDLVGSSNSGTITSCTNTGGDLVDSSNSGTITSCTNTGGYLVSSTNSGTIIASTTSGGSIVYYNEYSFGSSNGSIIACYVADNRHALVEHFDLGNIISSYYVSPTDIDYGGTRVDNIEALNNVVADMNMAIDAVVPPVNYKYVQGANPLTDLPKVVEK